MNKPIKPPQTQAQKDQDTWIQIGEAAKAVADKLTKRKGGK